jgi:hypothetical protein
MRSRHHLAPRDFHELVERFADQQDLTPGRRPVRPSGEPSPAIARVLARMLRVVREHREGL